MSLVVLVALIVGLSIAIDKGTRDNYIFLPGTAPEVTSNPACQTPKGQSSLALPDGQPCVRLDIPAGHESPITGKLYMVDVLVGPASVMEYIEGELGLLGHLHPGSQLVPTQEVLGGAPASQQTCEDNQQMSGATQTAQVEALRTLGYTVPENDLGAQVDLVVPGTAAGKAGVQCNDLITAFDGTPIHTDTDLATAIRAHHPGDTVTVTVSRQGQNGPTTKQLTTTLTGTPASSGEAANPNQAFLGVGSETRYDFTLPFPISYDVGDIGGPSAGLALTLGLMDSLSGGNLFAGHRIAATGTMDLSGDVGDVGGVAQKTVAVRRAGAQIFFVPVQEYKAAKSEAGSHLEVKAVSSLSQVLNDLSQIGGTLSKPSGQAA